MKRIQKIKKSEPQGSSYQVCFKPVKMQQYKRNNHNASNNYTQIDLYVILYLFFNQGLGHFAPSIATSESAYILKFMLITAMVNKR